MSESAQMYWLIFRHSNGEEVRSEKPVTHDEALEAQRKKSMDKCPGASKLIVEPVQGTEIHDTDTD